MGFFVFIVVLLFLEIDDNLIIIYWMQNQKVEPRAHAHTTKMSGMTKSKNYDHLDHHDDCLNTYHSQVKLAMVSLVYIIKYILDQVPILFTF